MPSSPAHSVARSLALSLALFTALNLAGAQLSRGFDANIWWIDLRFLPPAFATTILVIASAALLCFAIGFPSHRPTQYAVTIAIAGLTCLVFYNIFYFYRAWASGQIHPGVPIPFSLLLAIALLFILRNTLPTWERSHSTQWIWFAATFASTLVIFPIAQMYCYGKTDYRRSADAIVVFGARTYADGTPSWVLSDRTETAIHLYQQKLAPLLIFSGGPGDGPISEPQAMQHLALSMGVPSSDIILDEHGLNTEMTVKNTLPLFNQRHISRVLAVSHFYHLPRVKMTYNRTMAADSHPVTLFTVPAEQTTPLLRMPWYIVREVAASWTYYLRPLSLKG